MTEKQFKLSYPNGAFLIDGDKPLCNIKNDLMIIDKLNELAEENEQLKKENYELHKRLGDFEPFEEYLKERTSKTSLEDIIGIVKTDEPTNSVELKKELYK